MKYENIQSQSTEWINLIFTFYKNLVNYLILLKSFSSKSNQSPKFSQIHKTCSCFYTQSLNLSILKPISVLWPINGLKCMALRKRPYRNLQRRTQWEGADSQQSRSWASSAEGHQSSNLSDFVRQSPGLGHPPGLRHSWAKTDPVKNQGDTLFDTIMNICMYACNEECMKYDKVILHASCL